MKIYVTTDKDKKIEGFHVVTIQDFDQEMSNIVPNSSECIVAEEIIDHVPYNIVQKFISVLSSKLRKNGTMTLTGFDLGLVTRYVLNGAIDEQQYSDIVSNRLSMHNMKSVCNYCRDLNLIIENATLEGIKYEIYAKR